jgi:uncharacterized protein YcbX
MAKLVGRIAEIWRYPVSSLGGERLSDAGLTAAGITGDRQFALVDAATGLPAAPEKHARWRKALHLHAQCAAGALPTITFPDGSCCPVDDMALNGMLSDYFGFATAVAAHQPVVGHPDFPRTAHRDAHFPVHALTTASLNRLAELRQVETVDVRRFRPTVLIETDAVGFVEKQWIGHNLRIGGGVRLQAIEETTRCGMTFIEQPGVADDPDILRTILRHNRRHLGINCTIDRFGSLREGDDVVLDDLPA